MMKKLVALLMALALLCTSIGAFAEEPYTGDHSECSDAVHASEEATQKNGGDKAPTCEGSGYEWYWCSTHKAFFKKTVNALNHDGSGDWETVTPATEKAAGKKVLKCARTGCEEVLDEDIILPTSFNTEKADPSLYDLSNAVNIPTDGPDNEDGIHKLGFALKTNPTALSCKAQDYYYYCIDCEKQVKVTRSAGQHSTDAEPIDWEAPTCTKDGFYKYKGCKVCGDKDVEWTVVWASDGHKYDPNKPDHVEEATCISDGYNVYYCSVETCKAEVRVKIADKTGHSFENLPAGETPEKQQYVVPATCTKDGKYSLAVVCDVCGAIMEGSEDEGAVDTITKLNHQAKLNELQEKTNAFYKEDANGKIVLGDRIATLEAGETIQTEEQIDTESKTIGSKTEITGKYGQLKYVYTPATCTEKGHISVTCTVDGCGASIEQDLDPLDHHYTEAAYEEAVKIYDCTKGASVMVRCERYEECGFTFNIEIPARNEHIYEVLGREEIVGYAQRQPNGTLAEYDADEFSKIHDCADYFVKKHCLFPYCKHIEYVPVAGDGEHKADDDKGGASKEATCTEDGILYYECKYCGFPQIVNTPAKGHTMVNGKVLEEATCTKEGLVETYCEDCCYYVTDNNDEKKLVAKEGREIVKGTKVLPTIDHNWVEFNQEANCLTNTKGIYYKYCTMCQAKKDEVITSGHQILDGTLVVTKKPKCDETGLQNYTCSKCHNPVVGEVIPALGHTYQRDNGKVLDDEDVIEKHEDANDCTGYDCVASGCLNDTVHTLKCADCDAVLTWTEEETAVGHHDIYQKNEDGSYKKVDGQKVLVNSFTVLSIPTCEKEGQAAYNCSECGELAYYDLPKLPHNLKAVYDEDKLVYSFVCQPIYNAEDTSEKDGRDALNKRIQEAYPDDLPVGAAVYARIIREVAPGKEIGTFGAEDHVIEIPVKKTEFNITKISDARGQVELKDDTMLLLDLAYVRITWRYTLGNGDNISFVTTRNITWDFEENVGTFKLSGLTVPEDAHCDFIYVEVVTDPDADEKYPGDYTTFGGKSL